MQETAVTISPNAKKMIQQLRGEDQEQITRALDRADHLVRDARRVASAGDDLLVATVGTHRLVFKKEGDKLFLTIVYDHTFVNPAS